MVYRFSPIEWGSLYTYGLWDREHREHSRESLLFSQVIQGKWMLPVCDRCREHLGNTCLGTVVESPAGSRVLAGQGTMKPRCEVFPVSNTD